MTIDITEKRFKVYVGGGGTHHVSAKIVGRFAVHQTVGKEGRGVYTVSLRSDKRMLQEDIDGEAAAIKLAKALNGVPAEAWNGERTEEVELMMQYLFEGTPIKLYGAATPKNFVITFNNAIGDTVLVGVATDDEKIEPLIRQHAEREITNDRSYPDGIKVTGVSHFVYSGKPVWLVAYDRADGRGVSSGEKEYFVAAALLNQLI